MSQTTARARLSVGQGGWMGQAAGWTGQLYWPGRWMRQAVGRARKPDVPRCRRGQTVGWAGPPDGPDISEEPDSQMGETP